MNQDKLDGHLRAVVMPGSNERAHWAHRRVSVSRIGVWLVDGLSDAREKPLTWLVTVLVCADFATVLEFFTPLGILATLFLPVITGALMLTQECAGRADRLGFRATFDRVVGHRAALFTAGLWVAGILCAGNLLASAQGHVTLMPWTRVDGAHQLAMVFGERCQRGEMIASVVTSLVFAVVMAATWFAPVLIVLHRFSPLDALTASLRAVLRNWPVASCYAVLMATAVLTAPLLPAILRGLVTTPLVSALILLSMRGSYRDIVGRR